MFAFDVLPNISQECFPLASLPPRGVLASKPPGSSEPPGVAAWQQSLAPATCIPGQWWMDLRKISTLMNIVTHARCSTFLLWSEFTFLGVSCLGMFGADMPGCLQEILGIESDLVRKHLGFKGLTPEQFTNKHATGERGKHSLTNKHLKLYVFSLAKVVTCFNHQSLNSEPTNMGLQPTNDWYPHFWLYKCKLTFRCFYQ